LASASIHCIPGPGLTGRIELSPSYRALVSTQLQLLHSNRPPAPTSGCKGLLCTGDPHGDVATMWLAKEAMAMFKDLLTKPEGLNWLVAFAQAHHKRIVLREWAVDTRTDGHGLGDDPTFINDMHNRFITNDMAWSIYFNDDAADNGRPGIDFNRTDFPHSLAAYKADFG